MADTNLYVGNLPWNTTEDELKEYFSPHGLVQKVRIITDRETGRSRGFGFVEFADAASAEKALVEDGQDFGGRALRVSPAQRQGGNGGGQSRRPSNGPSQNRGPRRPRREYEEQ